MFRILGAVLVAAGLVFVPSTAGATPSSGVTGVIIAQKTVGETDYVVRRITIAPGGYTGWHFHDGTLYAYVRQGTLTRTMADCVTTEVSPAGSTIVEHPVHVHIGRNLGATPVVLDVLYVLPAGSPLSQDAPDPGCDNQG
ncbi:MAG: cupin domain-containing protein [Actinomycetota bacterium]|nr:cupin domain-containing protein [Actinomycetota bacterium]